MYKMYKKPSKDEILHALGQSISSHELRADGGPDIESCPLCDLFIGCCHCPIKAATGIGGCDRTPYFRTIERLEKLQTEQTYGECPCPSDCPYIESCANYETEFCIVEEEHMVSFLKWVRYNLQMGWI